RILDHLLHTGYAAAAVIEPYFAPIDPVPPRPGVTVDGPATAEDALEWFTAERATLLAAVRLAAKTGFATYTWQLTWAMTTFLLRRGLWSDHATACEAALDAARYAGYSHAQLGNYQQAIAYCERALAGSQEMGERNWEAATWHSLGYIYHQLGDNQRAVGCYERSLDLCRALADRFNEADTLEHLGDVHHSAGDIDAAHWAWTQALRIFDEIDHPGGDRVRAKLQNRDDRAAADGVVSQALGHC